MAKVAIKKFKPTDENVYFFRKVIKNPMPIKIITWTSWKTEMKIMDKFKNSDHLSNALFVVMHYFFHMVLLDKKACGFKYIIGRFTDIL